MGQILPVKFLELFTVFMTMSSLLLRIISFHHFSGVILVLGKGKNCYPFLFAIYLNDLEIFFVENDVNDLENINRNMCSENLNIFVKLFSLLYADDIIILSETEADMQYALAIFEKYCHHWKLKVNLQKTKIIIFCKGK